MKLKEENEKKKVKRLVCGIDYHKQRQPRFKYVEQYVPGFIEKLLKKQDK